MIVPDIILGLVPSSTAIKVDDLCGDAVLVTRHVLNHRPDSGFLKAKHEPSDSTFKRRPDRVSESCSQNSLGIALSLNP
jgi:hypothetical protein